MILVVAALSLLAAVPLAGGRLGRLADVEVRGAAALFTGLAVQILIVTIAPGGSAPVHAVTHVGTYVLGAWFLWANRALPGMTLVAAGAALNIAAIAANAGVMPASPWAVRTAGLQLRAGFDNSAPVAHPHLAFLGDVIPVPAGPLANVLSAGDLLLYAGAAALLTAVCGVRSPAATRQ